MPRGANTKPLDPQTRHPLANNDHALDHESIAEEATITSQNAFRDFADWRLQIYKVRPRESVRFFRSSLDHSMVWMLVMRGHFDGVPPTVGECQTIGRCSPLTARKMIADAVVLGYFELKTDSVDQRKRSVHPTERTITEYIEMVQGYAAIFEKIRPDMETLGGEDTAQKAGAPLRAGV